MPASPLSAQQLADAARLKSRFNAWKDAQRAAGERMSQEQASELLGFGQSALSQYLNGKIPLNVEASTKIAKLIGCQVEDFSTSLAQQVAGYSIEIGSIRNQKTTPDELVIPQFESGGSMGRGLLLRDQPGIIRGWTVNQEWIQKNVPSNSGSGNLCIVTGFGPSMRPLFNPGDPLLVDRGVTCYQGDAIYFFRVGDEGFIKSLQSIPGQGFRVISANRDHFDPWTITEGMDFEVFGRVLKVWKGEDF